jgi:hypothetical protein
MSEVKVYIGLTGAQCECNRFEFAEGIVLEHIYAHFIAPHLLAFVKPQKPDQPHPAPWAIIDGGGGQDIELQLQVDETFAPNQPWTFAWWIVALIRLRTNANLLASVYANHPLTKESTSLKDFRIKTLEFVQSVLTISPSTSPDILKISDLEWVKQHWYAAAEMMPSPEFSIIFHVLVECRFVRKPELALLMLWAGLEEVFSPNKSELRFRVSSLLAAYLEPPGRKRLQRQKEIAKLYDLRSSAAHGRGENAIQAFRDTYELARSIIFKMIAERKVPTKGELEERLFGVEPENRPPSIATTARPDSPENAA